MRQMNERILALAILCIPGIFAVYGWTLLRETIFNYFAGQGFMFFPFCGGVVCFLGGLSLIAGFIFFHDKKRNKIQAKLLRKKRKYKE